jgi:hypothetical protein
MDHRTDSTIRRQMRTRSGLATDAASPVIPTALDTRCVWTETDGVKTGACMVRLQGYGGQDTYGDALLSGMRPADWPFDVMHGLCTIQGFRLPKVKMKKCRDRDNVCFACQEPFSTLVRGRVYRCRHQVCYDCDNVPHHLRVMRCGCGRDVAHL